MSDLFFNDFSVAMGVLSIVEAGFPHGISCADNSHIFASNGTLKMIDMPIYLTGNRPLIAPSSVMVSPDDGPPIPPR